MKPITKLRATGNNTAKLYVSTFVNFPSERHVWKGEAGHGKEDQQFLATFEEGPKEIDAVCLVNPKIDYDTPDPGVNYCEIEVLQLVAKGQSNKEIGKTLHISTATVKTHLRNAKRKFGLRSKLELRKILADWDFSQWAV